MPVKEMNILIAIPCYGGVVQAECMMSLIQLHQLLTLKRIEHTISAHSDSLVTRVRNHFANMAAFDSDAKQNRFTHLLQIDADSRFQPADILRMLELDRPIVGLPYALQLRILGWSIGAGPIIPSASTTL